MPAPVAATFMLAHRAHPEAVQHCVDVCKGKEGATKGEAAWALDQFLTKHTNQLKGTKNNMSYANYNLMIKYVAACVRAHAEGSKRVPKPDIDSDAWRLYRDAALESKKIRALGEDVLQAPVTPA